MTYPLWRTVFLAFVVLCIGGPTLWIALRPTRRSSRLGMRGRKRQQALLRYPSWATIEPFVRWMGVRVSPLLTDARRAAIDTKLTHAGDFFGLSAEEYAGAVVASAALGAVVGTVVAALFVQKMGLAVVAGATVVFGTLPHIVVDSARGVRFQAINRGLPAAIDMMGLSMSAGLDFPSSLREVVDKSKANELLREELEFLLHKIELGTTRAQALRELAERAPVECVGEFAQAIIQAEERGNPVALVLETQATTSRTRRSNAADKAIENMKAKMVLPTMLLAGLGMVIVMVPTNMMLEKFTQTMAISGGGAPR